MFKLFVTGQIAVMCISAWMAAGSGQAQNGPPAQTPARAPVLGNLDDRLLEWPLPPGEERYRAIDGKHLHEYVVQQAEISRHYRDQGHPKFWGRIIGTSGDVESAEWLAARFKTIGLT